MCGDGLQVVTSLKQVTGASLLKRLYLSVRFSHILSLSFTSFHFLNGTYSSVGNSQKTQNLNRKTKQEIFGLAARFQEKMSPSRA